ncbi:MAG TPA: hypothetical protein VGQ87_01535, partial [Patescibacteria group bacterium]|nr:hypothetical protein [Patescibacteria group bacterium]
ILDDGSIISTVKIKRQNNSVFDNRDYLRILVPLGSEMISTSGGDSDLHLPSLAEGLQTDQDLAAWDKGKLRSGNIFVRTEAGKTEFAAWVSTPANSEKEISFSYQLPFKLSLGAFHNGSSYSLLLQKQPGATALQFEQVLDFGSLQKAWSTGNSTIIGNSGTFISYSQTDDYWGVIFK